MKIRQAVKILRRSHRGADMPRIYKKRSWGKAIRLVALKQQLYPEYGFSKSALAMRRKYLRGPIDLETQS